jgi:hypothetical protein
MKNIHILPTDKPSRTYKVNSIGKLDWSEGYLQQVDGATNQNTYITNDEEIKEGDFTLSPINAIVKCECEKSKKSIKWDNCKKIILTTDQDLIKDGVQAIDDEFLEWFVKNPSCEEVGVIKEDWMLNPDVDFFYKIIIPKEELKSFSDFSDKFFGSIPKEEPKQKCKDCNTSLEDCTCIEDTIDMKQETLEKAAENYWLNDNTMTDNDRISYVNGFKEGYKLAQERSYNEEDVLDLLCSCPYEFTDNIKKWFEQFKNK